MGVRIALLFLLALPGIQSLQTPCASSGIPIPPITLSSNGYEGITIAINEDVDQASGESLIENIKTGFTNASAFLHFVSDQRVYFKTIKILVPSSWQAPEGESYESAGDLTYTNAAFQILDMNTENCTTSTTACTSPSIPPEGVDVCGYAQERVSLDYRFILDNNNADSACSNTDLAKLIVHEWSHLRYGVFDEYEANAEIPVENSCSVGRTEALFLEREMEVNSAASIMAALTPEMGHWCEDATEAAAIDPTTEEEVESTTNLLAHDSGADNPHNRLCAGRSVKSVIEANEDFIATEPATLDTTPQFTFHQLGVTRISMVLDRSGSMKEQGGANDLSRYTKLMQGASHFIDNLLPSDSRFAIANFNNEAILGIDFNLVTDSNREDLKAGLPAEAGGGTEIAAGMRMSMELAAADGDLGGALMIVVSDGQDEDLANDATIADEVIAAGVKVCAIAISDATEPTLDQFAVSTGGKNYFVRDDDPDSAVTIAFENIFVNCMGGTLDIPLAMEAAETEPVNGTDLINVTVSPYVIPETDVQDPLTTTQASIVITTSAAADENSTASSNDTEVDVTTLAPEGTTGAAAAAEQYVATGSFLVDSSLGLGTQIRFDLGDLNNILQFELITPNGTVLDLDSAQVNLEYGTVVFEFGTDIGQVGNWSFVIYITYDFELIFSATSQPEPNTFPITIDVQWALIFVDLEKTPPDVQKVYATVVQGPNPLYNASVSCIVTDDQSRSYNLTMEDNGVGADQNSNDGIYSSYFTDYELDALRFDIECSAEPTETTVIASNAIVGYAAPQNTDPIELVATDPFTRIAVGGTFQANIPENYDPSDPSSPYYPSNMYAPSPINDLRVQVLDVTERTVELSWTAVGDYLVTGTAASYRIFYTTTSTDIISGCCSGSWQEVSASMIVGGDLTSLESGALMQVTLQMASSQGSNFWFSVQVSGSSGQSAIASPRSAVFGTCEPGCVHGTCMSRLSLCYCEPGWYGQACDENGNNTDTMLIVLIASVAGMALILTLVMIYITCCRDRTQGQPYPGQMMLNQGYQGHPGSMQGYANRSYVATDQYGNQYVDPSAGKAAMIYA